MGTHGGEQTADTKSRRGNWRGALIGAVFLVVAGILAYFIASEFVPRWWAQRVADMSGHGSFTKGIGSGLTLGVLCTGIPLLLLLFAILVWNHRGGRFLAGAALVIGVIAALPNLMTLSIVLGTSNAAHAGQRTLDVDAPGFRGATLIGAIIAAVLFLIIVFLVLRRRHRRRASQTHPADQPQAS